MKIIVKISSINERIRKKRKENISFMTALIEAFELENTYNLFVTYAKITERTQAIVVAIR